MKKLLFVLFFALAFTTAEASNPIPFFLRAQRHVKSMAFTTPYLDHASASSNLWYSIGSQESFNFGPYSYSPSTSGGTLSATDYFGTTTEITWNIVGTTLSYTVDIVPGTGIDLGIHMLQIYDNDTSQDLILDDYEDPEGVGYGNSPYHGSGCTDISSASSVLRFVWQNYNYTRDYYNGYSANEYYSYIYR
ncbi:hypothetical protein ABDD95_14865 [Mucilaginibacter sp. PAMB04274]|uniref:hypothetical protein n=1 Tax=Mucilaginibacter sp. PAMB04274 TaxID=3138568 RepID=UPI0031F61184